LSDLQRFVGIPFVSDGRDPKVGLNCWGLVMHVGNHFGKDIPDFHVKDANARSVFRTYLVELEKPCWEPIQKPEKACIVAMALIWEHPKVVQHFGIGIDKNRFIHTAEKMESLVSRYDDLLWKGRIRGFYRWLG